MTNSTLFHARKSCSREHGNSTRFIPGNMPALTDEAKATICRQWRLGTPMRQIARNQRLTQPQVEAVIWERYAGGTPTPVIPTVLESRRPHVVVVRKAA